MTVPLNWYQSHHPARARTSLYLRSHMFSTRQIFIWPFPRFAKLQYYLGKEALRASITPRALCAFRIEKKKTTVFQSFLAPTKSPDLRTEIKCGKLYSAIHPPQQFYQKIILIWNAAMVYSVVLWYWTSMLWPIDTCQNKVSPDQYHVTIARAQVLSLLRSRVFLSRLLTKCWCFDCFAGSSQVQGC